MTYVPPATAITTATIVSYTRVAGYVVQCVGPRSISGLVLSATLAPNFRAFQTAAGSRVQVRVSLFLPHTATILGPG